MAKTPHEKLIAYDTLAASLEAKQFFKALVELRDNSLKQLNEKRVAAGLPEIP